MAMLKLIEVNHRDIDHIICRLVWRLKIKQCNEEYRRSYTTYKSGIHGCVVFKNQSTWRTRGNNSWWCPIQYNYRHLHLKASHAYWDTDVIWRNGRESGFKLPERYRQSNI